jgi:hypothetical protein
VGFVLRNPGTMNHELPTMNYVMNRLARSVCRVINLLSIAVIACSCVKAPQSEIMSWERYRAESRPGHYVLDLGN